MMKIEYDTTLDDIAVDAEDALEFHMQDGGFVIVRNKGFPTAESREEFKRAANQRLNGTARKLGTR